MIAFISWCFFPFSPPRPSLGISFLYSKQNKFANNLWSEFMWCYLGKRGVFSNYQVAIAVQEQLCHFAAHSSSSCPVFVHKHHCCYRAYIVLSSACRERTDQWRERVTCIPTAVLAQGEMLVLQHGSYQNKSEQGCIVLVLLRKTRESVFFSTREAGENQYDHTFVISSRRNQHPEEFLGKEKSPLEKLRPLQVP